MPGAWKRRQKPRDLKTLNLTNQAEGIIYDQKLPENEFKMLQQKQGKSQAEITANLAQKAAHLRQLLFNETGLFYNTAE